VSYQTFPSKTSAGAPPATDDNTKGFVVGSQWVDTSVSPRKAYICTDASTGAAVWLSAGGVSAHPSLTTLGWSASGHTGTTNSVACFSNTGAALTAQATVEGTVLSYTGGVLQFVAMTAAVALVNSRNINVEYLPLNATVLPSSDAIVVTGTVV
jgi:hypothetical protein